MLFFFFCSGQFLPPRGGTSSNVDLDYVARKMSTCPFIGSVVFSGQLPVRGTTNNPEASLQDIQALGNTPDGRGHFGELLAMFATGNHGFRRDGSAVDRTSFSLDFPLSQGSHAGDSGILQSDRNNPQFSSGAFARLTSLADSNGALSREAIGRFIAQNVRRDRSAKVLGRGSFLATLRDLGRLVRGVGGAVIGSTEGREVVRRLTATLAADNILGSSGEFGLMFALFSNRGDSRSSAGPVLFVDEMQAMFRDKRLPRGWEMWPKSRSDWAIHTTRIAAAAYRAYFHERNQ